MGAKTVHSCRVLFSRFAGSLPAREPAVGQGDAASAEKIAEVVMKCPTGALHFERLDGGPVYRSPDLRKRRSTRVPMVRSTFEGISGLQNQAISSFGKIRGSRYVGVATPPTNPFVTGVIVGLGFARPNRPKAQIERMLLSL